MVVQTAPRNSVKILFRVKSPYQEIMLLRLPDKTIIMTLDDAVQFSTRDERIYHEALFTRPLGYFKQPRLRVLVLGGGDGLGLRNLVAHPNVAAVTMVELDPIMVKVAKYHDIVTTLNRDSLRHYKSNIVIGDAYDYVHRCGENYDLVIADFPDPTDAPTARLFSDDFFGAVHKCLRPGGMFATQSCSALGEHGHLYRAVGVSLKRIFRKTKQVHRRMPVLGHCSFWYARK